MSKSLVESILFKLTNHDCHIELKFDEDFFWRFKNGNIICIASPSHFEYPRLIHYEKYVEDEVNPVVLLNNYKRSNIARNKEGVLTFYDYGRACGNADVEQVLQYICNTAMVGKLKRLSRECLGVNDYEKESIEGIENFHKRYVQVAITCVEIFEEVGGEVFMKNVNVNRLSGILSYMFEKASIYASPFEIASDITRNQLSFNKYVDKEYVYYCCEEYDDEDDDKP